MQKLMSSTEEVMSQAATSGVISNVLKRIIEEGAEGLGVILEIVIPGIGALASIRRSLKVNHAHQMLSLEVEKLEKFMQELITRLDKARITDMQNYYGVKLNVKRYEFIKTICRVAMNAKTEEANEYVASLTIWAGVQDYSDEIEYRKLYRCLYILEQLDDLDFKILKYFDLNLLLKEKNDTEIKYSVEVLRDKILSDNSISTQEIYLSINKLHQLGLFSKLCEVVVYEDTKTRALIFDQIPMLGIANGITQVYLDFNRHIGTFI